MGKILDMYRKYKHHDEVFTNRDFCGQTYSGAVIYDLWEAVREARHLEELRETTIPPALKKDPD
jgi:hypothetical protein